MFLKEPVDEWEKITDENGITIIEKFYTNQEKYSFPFQMMAYISRLNVLRNALKEIELLENKKTIIITERSLYTDKMVFAKMLYDSGKIDVIKNESIVTRKFPNKKDASLYLLKAGWQYVR